MSDKKTGVGLIFLERQRQLQEEGWSKEHDSKYQNQELAAAAAAYATPETLRSYGPDGLPPTWPWAEEWWKPEPQDRIRELVKAGALIAAQIDLELSKEEML